MSFRWYHYTLGIGIVLAGGGFDARPSDEALDVLEHTSVHVEPKAEGLIDEERVRRVVGDRPIVVVAVGASPGACFDAAAALPDVIVLAPSTEGTFTVCSGDTFRASPPRYFPEYLDIEVEDALAFVEHDATDLVAQYVLRFDAHVAATFPGEPAPVRQPPPLDDGSDAVGTSSYVVLGLVFGGLALFGAHVVRETWRNAQWSGARTRRWRAETDARLNRLADLVLRPDEPEGQADAEHRADFAKRYVLALHEFGETRSHELAAGLEARLTALEVEAFGPPPAPPYVPKRRERKRRRRRR